MKCVVPDTLRQEGEKNLARKLLDQELEAATAAGFFGRVELILQNGNVEALRLERTIKPERPRRAA